MASSVVQLILQYMYFLIKSDSFATYEQKPRARTSTILPIAVVLFLRTSTKTAKESYLWHNDKIVWKLITEIP